jgi:hypothetical protein
MSKPLKISKNNWVKLKARLKMDYPLSVTLVRSKMRSVLGFTDRSYKEWNENELCMDRYVYLDFFDEKKKTMLILKYGNFISTEDQ